WLLLEDGQATLERGAPGGGEGPRRLRGNAMMAPGAGLITLALRAEAETEAGARAETGSETGSEAEAGAGEIVYELQFGPGFGSLLGVRIPAAGRSAEETRSLGLMRASPSRR
ncbi:MAG: hypothetical protein OEY14_10215, partial [Myxococcales bacterium]|nr:hypothetical protein [Myxococcales bacterium]